MRALRRLYIVAPAGRDAAGEQRRDARRAALVDVGADARRGARRIRRAIPPRRGLRGGDHDDAGDCLRVQDRTAALRLSSVYGCAVMPFTTR